MASGTGPVMVSDFVSSRLSSLDAVGECTPGIIISSMHASRYQATHLFIFNEVLHRLPIDAANLAKKRKRPERKKKKSQPLLPPAN